MFERQVITGTSTLGVLMDPLGYEGIRASNLALLKKRQATRIAIYTSAGSSHSWLWLASALEDMGFLSVAFVERDPRLPS